MKFTINLSEPNDDGERKISVAPADEKRFSWGCLAIFFIIWIIFFIAVLLTPVTG